MHLALADIALTNIQSQRAIILRIKASKTDQLRVGTTIALGATKAEICPVTALLDYLNRRGYTPGPLFITEGGTPLRRQAFVDNIQQALTAVGLEGSKFNGHSFRIGAATTASEVGVPETTIKILGRWRSMAYQRYIRPPPDKLAQVATMLVSPVSSGSELSYITPTCHLHAACIVVVMVIVVLVCSVSGRVPTCGVTIPAPVLYSVLTSLYYSTTGHPGDPLLGPGPLPRCDL